jgi:hypothetical protein
VDRRGQFLEGFHQPAARHAEVVDDVISFEPEQLIQHGVTLARTAVAPQIEAGVDRLRHAAHAVADESVLRFERSQIPLVFLGQSKSRHVPPSDVPATFRKQSA